MRTALFLILCCAATLKAHTQDAQPVDAPPVPPSPVQQAQAAQTFDRAPATLHGFVRNAVTGEGIPRAWVRIEGDADAGALTDGDGRFEISGISAGQQAIDVTKPGFFVAGDAASPENATPPHNVFVAADMPDVVFTLAPTSAIRGLIDLSTGEPAEGIQVGLLRRVVADGRAVWQAAGYSKTRSDGAYRFGDLRGGQYKLYTTPAFDSDPVTTLVAPGKAAAAERWGYAGVYYPDTRDPSGAASITLAGGSDVQANFTLAREPFQTVSISVVVPQSGAQSGAMFRDAGNVSADVTDGSGHQLLYPAQYDANAHTIQAALPDGSYAIFVTSIPVTVGGGILVGEADFSVAGRAITNLRVALTPAAPSPVQVTVLRSGAEAQPSLAGQVAVMLSPVQSMGGAVMAQYAAGRADGPLAPSYMAPGAYWAHTFISGNGLCESSFTAGGASLGREPLTIGFAGATAPMELTLRDDCAHLTLQLPENLLTPQAGEEKHYTVFAVPDFDFTWDISPVVLRPSSGGSVTLNDFTPGSYHVYTFEGDANLEYHNPSALQALPNPGQAVMLSPGATASLLLEAPAQ